MRSFVAYLCGRGTTNAHVPGCHKVALREIAPRRLSATCVLAYSHGAAGPVTIGLVAARPQWLPLQESLVTGLLACTRGETLNSMTRGKLPEGSTPLLMLCDGSNASVTTGRLLAPPSLRDGPPQTSQQQAAPPPQDTKPRMEKSPCSAHVEPFAASGTSADEESSDAEDSMLARAVEHDAEQISNELMAKLSHDDGRVLKEIHALEREYVCKRRDLITQMHAAEARMRWIARTMLNELRCSKRNRDHRDHIRDIRSVRAEMQTTGHVGPDFFERLDELTCQTCERLGRTHLPDMRKAFATR